MRNDHGLKNFYKLYCKILARVIGEAKQQQYSGRISTSKNKIKTTWNIVKSETSRKINIEEIPTISYNGLRIDDQRTMSSIFNDYFSSIAEKIMCTNITERITHLDKGDKITDGPRISSLAYPRIKYNNISTQEVVKIIKSLKTKNFMKYRSKF
jgi:hypothetical protein